MDMKILFYSKLQADAQTYLRSPCILYLLYPFYQAVRNQIRSRTQDDFKSEPSHTPATGLQEDDMDLVHGLDDHVAAERNVWL